jgi:3-phosphoshikimate 1-carboxyvinyltransferase
VSVEDDGQSLIVRGGPVSGGTASSRGDHRIAMALAVAALAGRGPVSIDGDGAVAKSYEGFFADLASLGAAVEEMP